MKPLTRYAAALLLAAVTVPAMAGGKHHKGSGHGHGHGHGHSYDSHHHKSSKHYRHDHSSYRQDWQYNQYQAYQNQRDRRRYRHDFGDHLPYVVGGAIIGSLLVQSNGHSHNGSVCYTNHGH
jgi:hypothetical protein